MSDNSNLVAIACVVDSSYTLASEWPRIFLEYITPLLKRLSEMHAAHQFRIAFVTYATSDTRRSPLLSKRFFAPLAPVTREFPTKLGLGHTGNGGRRGMAALEGLVAAMELFDLLRTSIETKLGQPQLAQSPPKHLSLSSQPICHIFHVAASPADDALRPVWNDSPGLDGVTWDSLPSEFRKRNINLSTISLRQLPKFAELHSSVAGGAVQQPWFHVRSPNNILLAGFPSPQQKSGKPAPALGTTLKRPGDAHIGDRTADAKRAKTQSSQSPIDKNATPPSQLHNLTQLPSLQSQQPQTQTQPQPQQPPEPQQQQPQLPQQSQQPQPQLPQQSQQPQPQLPQQSQQQQPQLQQQPQPQLQPSAPVPARSVMASITQQQIMERLRASEIQLQHLDTAIDNATASGNTQLAENLKSEKSAKFSKHQKFRAAVASLVQNHGINLARPAMQESDGGGVSGSNQPASSSPNKDIKPPLFGSENNFNPTVPGHDPLVLAQLIKSRTGSSNFPPLPVPISGPPHGQLGPPKRSPQLNAQMQKVLEQQRTRPPHTGGGPSSLVSQQPQNSMHSEQQQTSTNIPPAGDHSRPTPVWHGVLTWTGFDAATQGRKEVHAQVVAHIQPGNGPDPRVETWPATLTLTPAREPAVSTQDLQMWMKRVRPVLCTFQSQPRSVDTKANESYYRSLVQLLTTKGIYAVSGWTLPSGNHENNMLVFPVNGIGLGAALFPLSGIPELPKALAPTTLSSGMVEQLQRLTPGQKNALMARMIQQRPNLMAQQLPQQQQQSQSRQHDSSNPSSYPNMGMNGLGSQQLGTGMNLQQNAGNTAHSRSLSSGMQGGGVTNEILQSFMQRNANG